MMRIPNTCAELPFIYGTNPTCSWLPQPAAIDDCGSWNSTNVLLHADLDTGAALATLSEVTLPGCVRHAHRSCREQRKVLGQSSGACGSSTSVIDTTAPHFQLSPSLAQYHTPTASTLLALPSLVSAPSEAHAKSGSFLDGNKR